MTGVYLKMLMKLTFTYMTTLTNLESELKTVYYTETSMEIVSNVTELTVLIMV